MKKVSRSALVPYSADQMYALVVDVDAYPQFLPWCGFARELERGEDYQIATVGIDFKGLKKAFTTRNALVPGSSVAMSLIEGPFRNLEGRWHFVPLGETGSKIEFDVEFDFSSALVAGVLGPVFGMITKSMIGGFMDRARQVYGDGE